jgi:dTDP-4-amino-4,6-dideoxygalactose transaminase
LADELRARYAPSDLLLTDSGTSALRLALQAAHRQTGAPVALPAYTCFDVATAADGAGVPFFLYDLIPETLSPEPASLRRAFGAGARSAVVAHLYGVPVDLKAVQKVAGEFGAIIIEDAAQGSGCEWKGRPAGAHGTLGVLSFGRGKGMTGGRGGALLINDPQLLAAVKEQWTEAGAPRPPLGSVKDVALLKAQWLFGRPWLYWIPTLLPFLELGETIYRRPHPIGGLSALAAGVVGRMLRLVPDEIAHRRTTARWLRSRVTGVTHISPAEEWEAGWLRYPVILPGRAVEEVGSRHRAAGMMPGYPRAMPDLEGFGVRRLNPEEPLEGARMLAQRLVTFPTHHFVDQRSNTPQIQ